MLLTAPVDGPGLCAAETFLQFFQLESHSMQNSMVSPFPAPFSLQQQTFLFGWGNLTEPSPSPLSTQYVSPSWLSFGTTASAKLTESRKSAAAASSNATEDARQAEPHLIR
ncbi:MAG: hypothetical protein ACLFWF_13225 [Alphaproteobacteria bacterium]